MVAVMLALIHRNQVLKAVVCLDTIEMMDVMACWYGTVSLFPNEAVFENIAAFSVDGDTYHDVSAAMDGTSAFPTGMKFANWLTFFSTRPAACNQGNVLTSFSEDAPRNLRTGEESLRCAAS